MSGIAQLEEISDIALDANRVGRLIAVFGLVDEEPRSRLVVA